MADKEIIVAIDFGSSGAGYAYAFRGKNKIYSSRFEGTGEKIKTLNEVILNDSNEIVKYGGYEVKNHIRNGNFKQGEHYYQRIKMNLYENKSNIISVNDEKEIDIGLLIFRILEYIKKHAITTIIEKKKGLGEKFDYEKENNKIKWILTVPAIWNEKNKNIMINAAENAGIVKQFDTTFFLALEPEAASYYCLNDFKEKPNSGELFNSPYIICDLGGGTADIVCHERIYEDEKEKMKEKCEPRGGPFGSNEINEEFKKKVLKLLFGEQVFDKLKEEFNKSLKDKKKSFSKRYMNLDEEINLFKESIDENYSTKSCLIDCSIFFINNKGLNIDKIINDYNKKCKKDWKIIEYGKDEDDRNIMFPYTIIYDLTKALTDKISKLILDILSKVNNVGTILYVGGFCNSKFAVKLIQNEIKKQYPKIRHIIPNNPDNTILYGAVHYGLDPERIKSRKAKYSLGINAYVPWEDKYNGRGIKIYDEEYNGDVCKNAFDRFISKDEDIPFNKRITKLFSLRDYGNGVYGSRLIIYKSSNPNTLFIDEDGVEEIGRFDFTINNGNYQKKTFLVTLELGGTFLNASAFHQNSGTRVNMIFNY